MAQGPTASGWKPVPTSKTGSSPPQEVTVENTNTVAQEKSIRVGNAGWSREAPRESSTHPQWLSEDFPEGCVSGWVLALEKRLGKSRAG